MRFGRLLAVRVVGRCERGCKWLCQCDCGRYSEVKASNLKNGNTKSCGCLRGERIRMARRKARVITHKSEFKSEFVAWSHMKERCTSPKNSIYHNYGGRGITVCDRWLRSFENFLADVGPKPTAVHTLGRINNNGNYEPTNVRWETKLQQANNRRTNVFLTHDSETLTVAEWSRKTGLTRACIECRIRAGWSHSKAITTPVQYRGRMSSDQPVSEPASLK